MNPLKDTIDAIIKQAEFQVKEIIGKELPKLMNQQRKDIIDSGGTLNGDRNWKELAPSTVRRKGNSKFLKDTGKLYTGLDNLYTGDTEGNIEEHTDALPEYAQAVNKGVKGKKGWRTPPRDFLTVTPEDELDLEKRLGEVLQESMSNVSLSS